MAAKVPFSCVGHGVDIFHVNNKPRLKLDEISRSKFLVNLYAPGAYHRTYMRMQGALESKIKINPQAIDLSLFGHQAVEKNKNKVVCIGRFVEKKGIDLVIKAADFHANLDFDIYGYGDLEGEYLDLCRKSKHNNVFIKGSISDIQQLVDVYASAQYFLLPCRKAENGDMDGFPTVLGEAFASGCLPITTDISSIGSYLRDMDSAIFVEEPTVQGVSEAIGRAASLPAMGQAEIINKGLQVVSTNFAVDHVMKNRISDYYGYELSIFLVSYNSLDCLKEIIRRIYKYTRMRFKIIVVDNNSNAETKAFLKGINKRDNASVIFQEENTFCGPASNRALDSIDTEYAVYLCSNEGFVLDYEWEKELVHYMDVNQDVAIAGGIDYSPSFHSYEALKGKNLFDKFRNREWADKRKDRFFFVQGGIYILRMSSYKEAGGFSNDYQHNLMDVEYSFYLQSLGYKIGDLDCVISKTVKTLPSISEELSVNTKVAHPMNLSLAEKFDSVVSGEMEWCPINREPTVAVHDELSVSRSLIRIFNRERNSYLNKQLIINDLPAAIFEKIIDRCKVVHIKDCFSRINNYSDCQFLVFNPSVSDFEILKNISKSHKGVRFYTDSGESNDYLSGVMDLCSISLIQFKEFSHKNLYMNFFE